MSNVGTNYEIVRGRVEEVAARVGRPVDLLVVSKTWAADDVREVVNAGHLQFGENRLQESEIKIPQLPNDLKWHFIGSLQRNKVRKILSLFSVIHSVSSLKLASFINRVAGELQLRPEVFLEVNLGQEDSKDGFQIDQLRSDLEAFLNLEHLDWRGLMCLPPQVENAEQARPWFAKLREFQSELEGLSGRTLPELSMGMSGDFEVAIEEGSTIVRVGSAIFGPRIKT